MSNKQKLDLIFTENYKELLNYTKKLTYSKRYNKFEPEEVVSAAYEAMNNKKQPCLEVAYIKRTILQLIVWYNSTLNYTDTKNLKTINSIQENTPINKNYITHEDDYNFLLDLDIFKSTLNYEEQSMLDLIIKDKTTAKDIGNKFNVSKDATKIRQLQKTIKDVKEKFNIYYK